MTSQRFVLLCAEDDDLALVRWVHDARQRGLLPEVVSGVEHDDAPMLEALADRGCLLFVLLRSEHMGAERMRQLKTAFSAHRRVEQRLVALRLGLAADTALDRIAAELGEVERPRSEISMVIAIEEVLADVFAPRVPAPMGVPVATPMPVATAVPVAMPMPVATSVAMPMPAAMPRAVATPMPAALPVRRARTGAAAVTPPRAEASRRMERRTGPRRRIPTAQHEATGRYVYDDETLPMSIAPESDPAVHGARRASRGGVWLAALGLLGAGAAAIAIAWHPDAPREPDAIEARSLDAASGAATSASSGILAPVDESDDVVRIRVASPMVEAEPSEVPRRASPRRRDAARSIASDVAPTTAVVVGSSAFVSPSPMTPIEAPSVVAPSVEAPSVDEGLVAVGAPQPAELVPAEIPVEPAPLEDDVDRKLPRR